MELSDKPDDIREAFLGSFLRGFEEALHIGFIFGSLAKGYYKSHHDIDIFLVFKEKNDAAMALARKGYYSFHARFGAPPDIDYPGEFYFRREIENFICAPLCCSTSWRNYGKEMLDRLFVAEVLSGPKMAIFGDVDYLSDLEARAATLLKQWRAAFNAEILGMSHHDVLNYFVFGRRATPTKS